MKKVLILVSLAIVLLAAGLIYAYQNFKLDNQFTPVPLQFNPVDSTSSYNWNGVQIEVQGGFVKGKVGSDAGEELLIRSISPLPKITVGGKAGQQTIRKLRVENVNPTKTVVKGIPAPPKIVDFHTISLTVTPNSTIELIPKDDKDYLEFIILGDNRNGYKTFSQILDQVNAVSPVFSIDNGDLVFGGEANKYRLFYETVSKLQVPLYTTLGNHDIRENGRPIYTKLFGPAYYSFDYRGAHFVFLDSSRGWTEKTAIPPEQYRWLESDLQKAQGKMIFVISHIPPTDPRSNKAPNTFPDIPGVHQTSFYEKLMDNYSAYKNLDHAFPDKQEAKRFEDLMSKYKVNTVFLSHIHSYFSFIKGDVRYIISGGAGAELLTTDSYYHYVRVKVKDQEPLLEIIQLTSPPNQIQDRYLAAIQLFVSSVYKEYTPYVISAGSVITIALIWIFWRTRKGWWPKLKLIGIWAWETGKFAVKKYKEIRKQEG